MSQNIMIDPAKRDYVVVNGRPVPSDRIFEKAYIALMIPKSQWLYGEASQGSYLYTLQNAKRGSSIERLFANYSDEAIQAQLIAKGDASAVRTTNIATGRTGTSNNVAIKPAQSDLTTQFSFSSVR